MFEQQLYGIAESVTRDANGSLEIEDGQLTFCAPTDPSWLVTAETLNVDPNTNTGEAWGARIDIKGVPVAYLPWVQFPLNDRRKTGLLFPISAAIREAASMYGSDIYQPGAKLRRYLLTPPYSGSWRRSSAQRAFLGKANRILGCRGNLFTR